MTIIGFTAFRNFQNRLNQSQFYDWAMRIPIVGYSLSLLVWDVFGCWQQVVAQPAVFLEPDSGIVIMALAKVSQWMFIALLAILPVFRLRPIAKSDDILPRVIALAAVCVPPSFMLFDRAPPSVVFDSASVVISLVANIMAVVTVSFLGRSLSVMPEARRLVTSGPYAMVRHPLYLCEILGIVAMVLQYRSIPVIALFVLLLPLQVARGRWEEGVLARAFPDFSAYRMRTPFLIPRDPVRFMTIFFADPMVRRRSIFVTGTSVALFAFALTMLPRLIG